MSENLPGNFDFGRNDALPKEFNFRVMVGKYITETDDKLGRINERLDFIDKLESENHEFNTKLSEVLLNLLKRIELLESKIGDK